LASTIRDAAKQFVGSWCSVVQQGIISEGDTVNFIKPSLMVRIGASFGEKIRKPVVKAAFKSADKKLEKNSEQMASTEDRLLQQQFQYFEIKEKVQESEEVVSLWLGPSDDTTQLRPPLPGQHLNLGVSNGKGNCSIRTYTISGFDVGENRYRISIKREPGQLTVSDQLHREYGVGKMLLVKGPSGTFFLDPREKRPIVLLSMGIGITPMLAMMAGVESSNSSQQVFLFHGYRDGKNAPLQSEVRAMAEKKNIDACIAYSQPRSMDSDYDLLGRISLQTLQDRGVGTEAAFFLCGSEEFTKKLYSDLLRWGVHEEQIHHEFFGAGASLECNAAFDPSKQFSVEFRRSNIKANWSKNRGSFLTLAEQSGLVADAGCRYGVCGACATTLISGDVSHPPQAELPHGDKILLCCAEAKTNVVLDV